MPSCIYSSLWFSYVGSITGPSDKETEAYRVDSAFKATLWENGGFDSSFRAHAHKPEATYLKILINEKILFMNMSFMLTTLLICEKLGGIM